AGSVGVVSAAGICPLQSKNYGRRNREGRAALGGSAGEIPVHKMLNVTAKQFPPNRLTTSTVPRLPICVPSFDPSSAKNSQSCVAALKPLSRLTMASVGIN